MTNTDFTTEEIEAVRKMKFTEDSFREMAGRCRSPGYGGAFIWGAFIWRDSLEGEGYWLRMLNHGLTDEARAKLERYAAIAEYLADREEVRA